MRMRIASLLALGVLVSMTLSAQTKISGTLSCAQARSDELDRDGRRCWDAS